VFLDDLQWAGRTPLGLVDLVLCEEPVEGLLLVGAFRDGDVDAAQPLTASLPRWREQAGVRHVRLDNLPVAGLVDMVAEILHVDPAAAAGLAELIHPFTSGNPYETVELLNALRRDGLVAAASRRLLEAMACLGGRVELSLLQTATATRAAVVEQALAPALDEGLLVVEPGVREAVRFRHDRTREAILAGLDPPRRHALQLAMARRLAKVPELFAVAAEQYLPVADAVADPAERARVVRLLRRAADQAALIGEHALVNALLAGGCG